MKLSKYIDHTALKADLVQNDIDNLVNEAIKNDFASVCINSSWVSYVSNLLKDFDVKVCTVVGFPLGQSTKEVKAFEAKQAIENGADEIDMVINISKLKDKKYEEVESDIRAVVNSTKGNVVKVILETCLLTKEEIVKACEISVLAGAHFVKTSTGFSTGGATLEDVKLMKNTVGDNAEVKASGGIRTTLEFNDMIKAGATRIGTSSGEKLIKGEKIDSGY